MPMKSQAMAIITLHKLVAASVDDFRIRFPDWSTTVSSVLKKKKKKRKLNVETVSGASEKPRNNLSVSGSEGEEDEKSDGENDRRSDVSNSESEEESVNSRIENEEENDSERDSGENSVGSEEEDSEKEEEYESDKEEETKNNLGSEDDSNEEFQNISESDIKKPIVKKTAVKSLKRHLEQPNSQPPNKKQSLTRGIIQKESNKVVKKHDEDKEGGKHPLKKSVKPRAVKEKPKVVDPFFMTTTNEEYLTSQVPTVDDNKDSNWKSKSDDYSHSRFNSFTNLNSRNQKSNREDNWKRDKFSNRESQQQHKKPFVQRSEKTSSNNGLEPFNIFTNRKERRKALQQPAQEEKAEKLHPSWEAKKKQTSIAAFQGKKITFD